MSRRRKARSRCASAALLVFAVCLLGIAPAAAPAASWSLLTTQNASEAEHSDLYDIACEPFTTNACVAVGNQTKGGTVSTYAQYWNGSSWVNQTAAVPAGATASELQSASCLTSTSCSSAGSYTTKSGTFSLIEAWNGTSWSQQTSPNPEGATETKLRDVNCYSTMRCMAVGRSNAGGSWAVAIQGNSGSWNLSSSVPKPAGAISSELTGVFCNSTTSCVAVGVYNESASVYWAMAAIWNGTEWTLQTIPKATKKSILLDVSCSDASNCTAVGAYTNASNVQVTYAVRWNGSSWTQQTSQNPAGSTNSVLQNVSCDDRYSCVGVGDWINSGVWTPQAQRWNGASWSLDSVAVPAGSKFGLFEGVSCRIKCLTAGRYTNSEGKDKTLGETRETPSWTQRTIPAPGETSGVAGVDCFGSTSCLAVGISTSGLVGTARAYSGGVSWTETTVPTKPSGATYTELDNSSCVSETTCFAVGQYVNSASLPKPYALRREGTTWTLYDPLPLPAGVSEAWLTDISCNSSSDCTAVGYDRPEAGQIRTYIVHWNGSGWSLQTSPNVAGAPTNFLKGVSCTSSTACTAVGYADPVTPFTYAPLVERWNGTSWSIESSSLPSGATSGKLNGVSCAGASDCFAVGTASSVAYAIRWKEGTWTTLNGPLPAVASLSNFEDVSCTASTTCFAVGTYDTSAHGKALAAAWDGSGWTVGYVPNPGSTTNSISGIDCLSSTSCRAVGSEDETNFALTYP
jgi:hypothetical protein